jgi:hypothetical protein
MKNLRKRAASIVEYAILVVGIAAAATAAVVAITAYINSQLPA